MPGAAFCSQRPEVTTSRPMEREPESEAGNKKVLFNVCNISIRMAGLCSLTAQLAYSHICEKSVHFTVHSTKS